MYIPNDNQEEEKKSEKKYEREDRQEEQEQEYESLEPPRDMPAVENIEDVLLSWEAPEFETLERDRKWYLYAILVLFAIIAYAIITNSPVMAITFILIGVVGYIFISKDPKQLTFLITKEGIIAGREIYPFSGIRSFWIFYDHNIRVISLKTDSYLIPYIHIPIEDEDPVRIREILLEYAQEEKHEPGMWDTLGRLLRF